MSTVFIAGQPCTLLARTRRAGAPFSNTDEMPFIGVDYRDYSGGGMCNVRLTVQQATALRDALTVTLERGCEITIAVDEKKQLVTECEPMDAPGFNPNRPFESVAEAVAYIQQQPKQWEAMIAICQANLKLDEVYFAKELAAAFVDSLILPEQR